MRVSVPVLVSIGAIAALVALGVTDQVIPASDPRTADVRPWVAARALGMTAYLLLAFEVALGLVLSHPRNTAAWRKTKQVFPWHEMVTVFTLGFLFLHITLLAVDRYAKVGWLGAFVPGFSEYRPAAIAVGSVALYTILFMAVTGKFTRLLPSGWWLKAHRFAAVAFLLAWVHAVLAGTDGGSLMPLYVLTGLPILAAIAHRWWTARARTVRPPLAPDASARSVPAPGRVAALAVSMEDADVR
jgi:methionine sulfoxide reductase heme-binding subunit